jgi:hypothetical protein
MAGVRGVSAEASPVLCAWQATGDVDYELLVVCPAIAHLGGVLACLRRCRGTEVTSAVAGPR